MDGDGNRRAAQPIQAARLTFYRRGISATLTARRHPRLRPCANHPEKHAPSSRPSHAPRRTRHPSRFRKKPRSDAAAAGPSVRSIWWMIISVFAAIRRPTCNAGWQKIERNLSHPALPNRPTMIDQPQPQKFQSFRETHCMKCQAGFRAHDHRRPDKADLSDRSRAGAPAHRELQQVRGSRSLADFRHCAAWAFHNPASYSRPQALSEPEEPSSPAPRAGDGGGNSEGATPAEERRISTGDGDIILPSSDGGKLSDLHAYYAALIAAARINLSPAEATAVVSKLRIRKTLEMRNLKDQQRAERKNRQKPKAGEADLLRTEPTAERSAPPLAQPFSFAPSCAQPGTVLDPVKAGRRLSGRVPGRSLGAKRPKPPRVFAIRLRHLTLILWPPTRPFSKGAALARCKGAALRVLAPPARAGAPQKSC